MTWWTTFFDDDFAELVLEREDDGTIGRTVADLVRFFEDAGFAIVELAGHLDRSAYEAKSPRCIVVGEVPE